MKRYIWLITMLSVLIIAGELLVSLYGPMARLARTPVILTPLYNTSGIEDDLAEDIYRAVESQMVRSGSYSIIKRSRWQDYFQKNPDKMKKTILQQDYIEIARELEIDKILVVYLYGSESYGYTLYLSLRDCPKDLLMKSINFKFKTIEELNESDKISSEFSSVSKRLSIYDYFFILLLFLQLILTVFIVFKRCPAVLQETVLVMTIVLFLFSYFYARNANMDYFQRFVASKGQVTMAENSRTEQLYAAIRYGPLLFLNLGIYLIRSARKRSGRRDLLLTLLSAVLYSLSFPNILFLKGLFPLAYIALIPLFVVLMRCNFSKSVFYGTVFGVIQAILINFWQGTYSYIGLALVTIGLLVQYALFMAVLSLVIIRKQRYSIYLIPPCWVIFEYLRSIGYLAFPWGLAGASQFPFTPLIQIASFTGIWGVSLMVLMINAAVTDRIVNRTAYKGICKSAEGPPEQHRITPLMLTLFAVILVIIGGSLRLVLIIRNESQAEKHFQVVVIQQNRDPRKHNFSESLDFAIELTRRAISESGTAPDLVVWPEGAFKPDIRMYQEGKKRNTRRGKLLTRLEDFACEMKSPIVTGTQDHIFLTEWDQEKGEEKKIQRNFNSSALLDKEGRLAGVYHKIHLVPFTEHFPYKKEFPRMWEFLQKYDTSNWLAGSERTILDTGKIRFITPICFEDVFPDHIRRFVLKDCDLIANMSNDYWSLSPVEGVQHGINGLFRAVENRRPMIRSTTSGYTVYADAAGRIINDVDEFFVKGVFTAEIPDIKRPLTLYTRWGDWLPVLLILFIIVESLYSFLVKPARISGKRRWLF